MDEQDQKQEDLGNGGQFFFFFSLKHRCDSEYACVHAQSLQLCPTLCVPMDCRPSASSVPWDSPGKKTGVGCHALLQGTFPTQGLNHVYCVSCIAGGFFTTEPPEKPVIWSILEDNIV